MSNIKNYHNTLIKGEFKELPYNEILYDYFSWIYDFSMFRHQHYALTWIFDSKEDLEDIALYSLLINRHDIKAKEVIEKYTTSNREVNFNPILMITRPEWLSSASKDMCEILLKLFPDNSSINYIVTSWSIMSDYDIKGLKYARDHNLVYESLNKEIPKHKYEIKVGDVLPYVKISTENDTLFGDNVLNIGDNILTGDL